MSLALTQTTSAMDQNTDSLRRDPLRVALDNHAIVSMADRAGRIIEVNDLFCAVSGYAREELLGQNHRLLKSEKHPPAFYAQMWASIAKGQVWQGDVCNRKRNGEEYWVRSTITPLMGPDGRPERYLSIRTDVTQLFETTQRLEATAGRLHIFERLIETTDQAIRVSDSQGRIEYVNPAYLRLLGYDHDEVIGQDFRKLGLAPGQDALMETIFNQNRHGTGWAGFLKLRRKDGSEFISLSSLRSLFDQETGALNHSFNIFMDYTEEIRRQETLREAVDQANAANKAKSDFLSSMSHELRTPMNAIMGFAQVLEYDEVLTADQQDSIHEILKAGKHLLELINEVLDLAKVESGRLDLSIEPVELAPVIDECHSLLLPLATAREIQLEIAPVVEPWIRADRIRLKQVLLNLLSNAIKYNRTGGHVYLSTHSENGRLRLCIADTGIGIDETLHDQIFQPFSRLGQEASVIEGTGIGLTITQRLVQMMGGQIGFESQKGKGSLFWVSFPLETSESVVQYATGGAHVDSDAGHLQVKPPSSYAILYMDDNPVNLKLMTQVLARHPQIALTTIHLPELGLELAKHHCPNLILLDINMPEMNGYDVLRAIRQDPRLDKTNVVAVTANAMPDDIERGRQAGFLDYITKPINVPHFLNMLEKWMS